ncbi:hypothetical protein KGF57_004719 [Candida theae]|uniref:Uncharacterized protein n=1 Tax=Candida theae TaxID=1198502 RepID=A0AAD5BBM9_9ASCO|nr:uncharacterized protein KGF57_004719 [Candida theae]KAI5949509.1 hypothetical protein KGF57_004719 [Candida theae]
MSLFLPEFHREIQAKFLDSVIPELKDESVNINNYETIDDLLCFFESSSDPPLIPSQDVFHLLLTISSRSASCNWSADMSKSKIGLRESHEQILASKHSDKLLHKSSLNDRSIRILENYTGLVYNGNSEVYQALREMINQLVTKVGSRQRSTTSSLNLESSPTPRIKEERRCRKRRHEEAKESQEGSDDTVIIISDSEEDYNDPEFKPSLESFDGSQLTSTGGGSSVREDIPESWVGIRVYDEPLLRDQFRINEGRFGIWELINWTFYCAGLSTSRYPHKDSNCHTIYQAQSSTLSFIFDVVEYNLVNTLKELFEDQDPYLMLFRSLGNRNKFASLQVEDNSNLLLTRLLQSIGYLQRQWYDRVTEFVFNGLKKLPAFPKTCYQHENILVRQELKKKGMPKEEGFGNENSDNMDSMSLRFKICAIVYYWSLVFDERVYSGRSFGRNSSVYLNSSELVKFTSVKFMAIDYRYLVEFYYSQWSTSAIPTKYKQLFLMNLAIRILRNLTGYSESVKFEFDDFLGVGAGHHHLVNNLDVIVSLINDHSVYAQVTEDESFESFEAFYQAWMKLNFILEWILSMILGELQDVGNSVFKDPIIYDKLTNADGLRVSAFQKFLDTSSQPKEESNFKFQLSEDSAGYAKCNRMVWEPFTSILSNYT